METILYEVEFTDGRVFRVFCRGSKEKQRFADSYNKVAHLFRSCRVITNGIHNLKEWEKIVEHEQAKLL